jgi:diguanylate cyclase (GGDEF)-like protein
VSITRRPGATKAGSARTAGSGEGPATARELVLVVDDDDQMLRLVKRVLERAGFECVPIGDGEVAHEAAVDWRPDIILLDLMLGSTTGDQILAEIRKDFRTRLIPVVFLTVRSSLKDKVEHLLAGADDYVTKPFIPEELVARLRAVISRSTNTRDLNPLTGMSGNTDILREINQRLKANERFAVLYPDIDTFKSYNDHYGFLRGDDVIKSLGTIILEVLEAHYSPHHFGGHVGGDDFVILTEPNLAETVATEITRRFDEAVPGLYDEEDRERGWIEYEDRSGTKLKTSLLSVSIGIVMAEPGSYESAAALASRAAEVKGVAKRMPGSRWVVDRRRAPESRGGRTR